MPGRSLISFALSCLAIACTSSGSGGPADGGPDGAGGAAGGFGGTGGGAAGSGGVGALDGSTDAVSGVTVSGALLLVNAPAGVTPSVILAPSAGFVPNAARTELPQGPSGLMQSDGKWSVPNVPAGNYYVLASFENDGVVLDPESALATVNVTNTDVDAGAIKLTGAIKIIAPDGAALVGAQPTLEWESNPSVDTYEVDVFDENGQTVWQTTVGPPSTSVPYTGPTLAAGKLHQFRVTVTKQGFPISRSEDLRGTFRPQ